MQGTTIGLNNLNICIFRKLKKAHFEAGVMTAPSLYEFDKSFLLQLFVSILNHHIRPQMRLVRRYQFVMFQNI